MFQTPELIIDKELSDLLLTDKDCTPLRMPLIHRKFRRDINDKVINCKGCNPVDSGNREGLIDCPYCDGLGYLWDDRIIEGWIYNISQTSQSTKYPDKVGYDLGGVKKLITLEDTYIYEKDYILEFELDKQGRITVPLRLKRNFRCIYSDRYASNGTNSQFNICYLES